MKNQNRLKAETQAQEQQESSGQSEKQQVQEFATAEDMIRHDRVHTPVPPAISQRLQKAVGALDPARGSSWWRRIFGGGER